MRNRLEQSRIHRMPARRTPQSARPMEAPLAPGHALLSYLAGALITLAFIVGLTGTVASVLRMVLGMP